MTTTTVVTGLLAVERARSHERSLGSVTGCRRQTDGPRARSATAAQDEHARPNGPWMHLEIRGRFRPAEVPPAVHSTSLKRGRSSVRDHATRPAEASPRSTEQTVDRAREHALSRPPNEAKIEMECKSFIGALLSGSGLKEDSEKQAYTACFRPPLTNSYYNVSHLFYKVFRSFLHLKQARFSTCFDG